MIRPGKVYPGTSVTLAVQFKDDTGAANDTTAVLFKTIDPNGVKTIYTYGTDSEITKLSTGAYKAVIKPAIAGRWFVRWEADAEHATEDNFIVQDSEFFDISPVWDYV